MIRMCQNDDCLSAPVGGHDFPFRQPYSGPVFWARPMTWLAISAMTRSAVATCGCERPFAVGWDQPQLVDMALLPENNGGRPAFDRAQPDPGPARICPRAGRLRAVVSVMKRKKGDGVMPSPQKTEVTLPAGTCFVAR